MNSVALLWPAAYNTVCEFLGANWYALVASMGLAALFIIHIIYALWLTIQNRRARGADRYAVNSRPKQVEWSSKNMLVLGIVVVAFLVVHMTQFWAKMQLQELVAHDLTALPEIDGVPAAPAFGTLFLQLAFQQWWTPVVYIIGFVALWFHMNHGFWSMFHTVGWDNNIWLGRLKKISCWWTSIVVLLFTAQAILFTVQAHSNFFTTDVALQEQYAGFWAERSEAIQEEFQAELSAVQQGAEAEGQQAVQTASIKFFTEQGKQYLDRARVISTAVEKQCPDVKSRDTESIKDFVQRLDRTIQYAEQMNNTNETNK